MSRMTFPVLLLMFCAASPSSAFDYFQPLPAQALVPPDNPITAAKVKLGKTLFFDPRLSADTTHSCNSCHNLSLGADDGRALSSGPKGVTRRSAPMLWNIGLQTVLYWDGRAPNLEAQFIDHLADPLILGQSDPDVVGKRIGAIAGYRPLFTSAFPDSKFSLSQQMARAVASFLRTLMTPDSRFDQFIRGDKGKLNSEQRQGMELFRQVGCLACHFGVNFAGPAPGPVMDMGDGFYELFPNHKGTRFDQPLALLADLGVYHVSKDPADKRLWRVPPLRNIALSAPYFHNGSAASLDQAIRVMAVTQLQKELNDREVAAIQAFLHSLTGVRPNIELPYLPQ